METLLFISGSVGAGKSTVGSELSTLLEDNGVPHTFIDLDALTYTYPRDPSDPYGNELALENLKAVWENARQRQSKNLIVPRVVESYDYAVGISEALEIPNPIVCRLVASTETLLERVRNREIGSGLEWHEARTLELAVQLEASKVEDFSVNTDARTVTDIATEIMKTVSWAR